MDNKKQLLFIVGSLRKASFNRQLAEEVKALLAEQAEVRYLDYHEIPYLNQDDEFPAPAQIVRVRKEVEQADALWIFTPEYNYNIPGVLKNLLDWLSRSLIAGDPERKSSVTGKAVTISGAGGKNATQSVRKQLDALLPFMGMRLMKDGETGVAVSPEGFATNNLTLSETDRANLQAQAEAFLHFIG